MEKRLSPALCRQSPLWAIDVRSCTRSVARKGLPAPGSACPHPALRSGWGYFQTLFELGNGIARNFGHTPYGPYLLKKNLTKLTIQDKMIRVYVIR